MSFRKQASGRKVFLTGASGVLGQALVAKMRPESVICLAYQNPISRPDVMTVHGDISQPKFGWSSGQWIEIASDIDCLVHAAAVTDFHQSDDKVMRINVHSLHNVFELAAVAKVPLYYISTAFVRPTKALATNQEVAYTVSKREAERLVRESGLPHVIVRPSIIIGDSASGAIARFQGFHSVLGGALDGSFPIVPASPGAYIDCIPQDTLADAILALIGEGCSSGEYWITAGEHALTINRLCQIVEKFVTSSGKTFVTPRFVTPDIVERLLRPVFLPALPAPVRKRFDRLLKISTYLLIDQAFPSSLPELSARLGLAPLPDLEKAVLFGLDYYVSKTRTRHSVGARNG